MTFFTSTSTDTASPQIAVEKPFSVAQTQVQAFDPPGDGAVVAETARVSVCYLGVNGRTGERFDSTYDDGKPASFPLDGVIPGFKKAIAGQKVGSSVGVAVAPEDGYLEIDSSYDPPRYYGGAVTSWTATLQCGDQSYPGWTIIAQWWEGSGVRDASADGRSLMATNGAWSWDFEKTP